SKVRLLAVQELRAFAALLVVVHHAFSTIHQYDLFRLFGNAGVDIFFVISGFNHDVQAVATTGADDLARFPDKAHQAHRAALLAADHGVDRSDAPASRTVFGLPPGSRARDGVLLAHSVLGQPGHHSAAAGSRLDADIRDALLCDLCSPPVTSS